MKSFKTSFSNLSLIGSSSTGITDASIIADQCSKVFDQLAALLTDLRSISTPEIILDIEQGIDKANNSEIGKSLAETIRLYADNCSVTGRETIQSALSEATTCINTCREIARKAQKKKKWDKDPQKKLEQNWFLFCREIVKISKLLPLSPVDLQLIHSLCNDDSDVGSVLEGKGHLGSYHTIESRHGAHLPTSSASRSRSSNRESSNGASTISGASQTTRSSTRKLQKHKSHSTLVSSPPAYSDIMKARYDQKDDEEVDEVLPIVPAPRPSRSSGASRPQGLFPSYPSNNYNPNTPLPQSVAFMGPMPPAILVPVFPQQYLQPQYPQQPQWPSPPPSAGVAYKSGSSITETVTKFALDIIHPELKCPCHIRHFGEHPRCWRNCCIWMGCV